MMRRIQYYLVVLVLATITLPLAAADAQRAARDTSFEAMKQRGRMAMGVDQETSVHIFDDLADGGRIELQRGVDDSAGVRIIREHLRTIARVFQSGDFRTPAFVHMRTVPGTEVMAEKRDVIRYAYRDLPRGGEVRITTTDRDALRAVHRFLAYQRMDHHASGHEMHAAPPR